MDEKTPGVGVSEELSLSLFGMLNQLDGPTLIGAFAGAIVFILSASDFHALKRIILGGVALVSGYISAPETVSFIEIILPAGINIHEGVGATFAAATIVRVLLMVSGKDGLSFITSRLGKK